MPLMHWQLRKIAFGYFPIINLHLYVQWTLSWIDFCHILSLSHCIAQLVENIFSQPTTMSTYVGRVEIINNKLYQNILKSPAVIIWRAYWFSSRNLYCFSSSSSSSACLCCCHLPLLLLTFQLNENFSKL